MKLDLPRVTALCFQGRPADFDSTMQPRLKRNLTYLTKVYNFHKIICINVIDPEVEGVEYIHTDPITHYDYCKWCLHNMSDYVDSDFVLSFQEDAWPLNPEFWTDEYLNYDYVASPIGVGDERILHNPDEKIVGGGFSLRSKRLVEFTKSFDLPYREGNYHMEDNMITYFERDKIVEAGMSICPWPLARKFSIQKPMDADHSIYTTFGYHARDWDTVTSMDKLIIERLENL